MVCGRMKVPWGSRPRLYAAAPLGLARRPCTVRLRLRSSNWCRCAGKPDWTRNRTSHRTSHRTGHRASHRASHPRKSPSKSKARTRSSRQRYSGISPPSRRTRSLRPTGHGSPQDPPIVSATSASERTHGRRGGGSSPAPRPGSVVKEPCFSLAAEPSCRTLPPGEAGSYIRSNGKTQPT